MHGLILKDQAQNVRIVQTSDGETATADIDAGDFGGHWLSRTALHFTFALTGDAVDETIVATNVGQQDEPIAIGAHPYFAFPSGDRAQFRVHVPATMLALVNNYHEEFPSGKLKPVQGTIYDYRATDGVPLDNHALDDNFSHLERTNGAVEVRLTGPEDNYGIAIDGLSPEIKTVQLYSPKDRDFVAVNRSSTSSTPLGLNGKNGYRDGHSPSGTVDNLAYSPAPVCSRPSSRKVKPILSEERLPSSKLGYNLRSHGTSQSTGCQLLVTEAECGL